MKEEQNQPLLCDCNPNECPVEGKCKEVGVIYQATVTIQNNLNNEIKKYIGLTGKSFKERYSKHISSFTVQDPRNSTSLSKKISELTRKHIFYDIKWEIIDKATPYKSGDKECRLCIKEIFHILSQPEDLSLNSRQEFTSKCKHQNRFKLCNI